MGTQLDSVPESKISAEPGGHYTTGRYTGRLGGGGSWIPSLVRQICSLVQLQAPTLCANDQIISVLQKLSTHFLLRVHVLLASCGKRPTPSFLCVSSSPFQVFAPGHPLGKHLPYYLSPLFLEQCWRPSCTPLILMLTLVVSKQD